MVLTLMECSILVLILKYLYIAYPQMSYPHMILLQYVTLLSQIIHHILESHYHIGPPLFLQYFPWL